MSYRICKDEKPQEWDGTHYLTCIHTLNSHSHIDFLMSVSYTHLTLPTIYSV